MCFHIVTAASLSTIVCDVADKVNLVLECVKDKEHTVKTIVLMEPPSIDLVNKGQQAGIQIVSLQEMEVSGHQLMFDSSLSSLEIFCNCYAYFVLTYLSFIYFIVLYISFFLSLQSFFRLFLLSICFPLLLLFSYPFIFIYLLLF